MAPASGIGLSSGLALASGIRFGFGRLVCTLGKTL